MKIKNILVTLLLCTMVLTACRAAVTTGAEASSEIPIVEMDAPLPVTSTISPEDISEQPATAKEIKISDGRVLVFQREGGIAGRSEEWIIYADGTIIDAKGERHHGDPRQIETIVTMADFTSLQESYTPKNKCCDLFTYTITFYADGETKRVTTMDGAKHPAELNSIINELGQLLAATQ